MSKLLTTVFFILIAFVPDVLAQNKKIIIDADTGNEMDDFYAITSALIDNEVEVMAVISTHFNNSQLLTDSAWHNYPTKNINTVKISQEENIKLMQSLDKESIPHPMGCDRMIGYAWGYSPGAPIPSSPVVDFIISEAKKAGKDEKLNIVCLGAVTNVAAAIETNNDIAKKIRLYALNMKYDVEQGIWNKNSFNARTDINGLDVVLNNKKLEVYIMPGNIARSLVFERKKTTEKLSGIKHPVTKLLTERWDDVDAGNSWIMWDLALIEALAAPELATIEKRNTPPENTTRKIGVYTSIEARKMEKKFWEKMEEIDTNQ